MDEQTLNKPYYLRPGIYIITAASLAGLLFLSLFITIAALNWINPGYTSFTLREDWSSFETGRYSLNDYWIPSAELPVHLKWAVIASEDQLFYDHSGFDLESIQEAWTEMQTGERLRGASTISQQTAKNLFLSPSQSFFRKGVEAGITVLIELLLSKERILEIYLNIAEFGPGIFGTGKAAEEFFGIHASRLEPDMSARLAAVLPNPKRMRVNPPSPFAEERSRWILRQMTQLSGIAWIPEPETQGIDSLNTEQYDRDPLLDWVESELERDLYGTSPDTIETRADSLEIEPGFIDSLPSFNLQLVDSVQSTTASDTIQFNKQPG
jgi:monofunctional glycosyltransferase